MKKIIFDCDNTVGIPGYPMDDALALLYVLGNSDKAEILGLTCTFGNGTADQVYGSTRLLLDEVQASGKFPLLRGAEKGEDPKSESARFIVEMANRYPGEVIFLGIGSVTNLYGAWLLDPELFEKLGQTVLMGGITEPLYTHGKHCPELNFSINKEATAAVLSKGKNISIITGNNCLGISYLPKEEFFERMRVESDPIGAYVAKKCGYRFDAREAVYGERGSYCWDVVAAAYAIDPELFD
ncbi:MAG: nucleoside hydrolase, partial [Clostridia bacterium]|nr:nucleoside hydrolase [Clostridia bacterium]